MAKQIWYPEEGDEVRLTDKRKGTVTYENQAPINGEEGAWQVDVDIEGDEDGASEVAVIFNESEKVWEEEV